MIDAQHAEVDREPAPYSDRLYMGTYLIRDDRLYFTVGQTKQERMSNNHVIVFENIAEVDMPIANDNL